MSFQKDIVRIFLVALFFICPVVCHAVEVCDGDKYYDSALETCVACPDGYTYDTDPGKTSVTQCKIQCAAGTYLRVPRVYGYTSLEYLESNGAEYINTGFTHSSPNIRGEIRVGTTNTITSNVNIIGNQINNSGYSVGWADAFKVWVESSQSRLNGPVHPLSANSVHDIVFELTNSTRSLTYDGQTVSGSHNGGIVTTNPIHLFDNGKHETNQNFAARIYYIRLYEDNVLVHNFVPVKDNVNDVPGLFDTVTGRFFVNNGDGTGFSYGGNLIENCVNVGIGYYSESSVVNFGDSGNRTPCPVGTYSNIDNATSVSACYPCQGATYNNAPASASCTPCPIGYNYDTTAGKTSANQCQIKCDAGTYLPAVNPNYTQLEYIEGTGTQYINTKINVSNLTNPIMSLTLQYQSLTGGKQSGAVKSPMNFKVGISNSGQFLCQAAGANSEISFGAADTNKHTFVLNAQDGTCSFDGTTNNLTVGDLSQLTAPISIGSVSTETSRIGQVRIYDFSLISNGEVILHLVPAMNNNTSDIGMWDVINDVFYPNSGKNAFLTGQTVVQCMDVGDGYYIADNITNYGSSSVEPTPCPNNALTHMTNATSINDCDLGNLISCIAGTYLPAETIVCATCPVNNYCAGGAFPYDAVDQGINPCPTTLVSPTGVSNVNQCGRMLRIDNDFMYLHRVHQTTPSLNIDIDNDGVADLFGNMTQTNVPITFGSSRRLVVEYDNQTWYVYDDSVDVSNP